jgi:hypothetical protein
MFAGLMFPKAGFNGAVRCFLLPKISRPPSLEIKTEVSIEDPHFSSHKRSNVLAFSGRRHAKRDLTHCQKRPDSAVFVSSGRHLTSSAPPFFFRTRWFASQEARSWCPCSCPWVGIAEECQRLRPGVLQCTKNQKKTFGNCWQ